MPLRAVPRVAGWGRVGVTARGSHGVRCRAAPRLSRGLQRVTVRATAEDADDAEVGRTPPPPPTPPLRDLSSPVDVVRWGGELPSPRRLAVGGLAATVVALGGNFLGVTSALLGTNPQLAEQLNLDIVVPVNGLKRCVDNDNGYEYVYPAGWLQDQRIALRNAERTQRVLDPLSRSESRARSRRFKVAEPVSAFGPAAGSGEENVSVIVAPILPGFSFTQMGTAEQAAQSLLATTIAPPGSDKEATLLAARAEARGALVYFTMEYTVSTVRWARHNLAVFVVGPSGDLLYTFNAQASAGEWTSLQTRFVTMAASFRLR